MGSFPSGRFVNDSCAFVGKGAEAKHVGNGFIICNYVGADRRVVSRAVVCGRLVEQWEDWRVHLCDRRTRDCSYGGLFWTLIQCSGGFCLRAPNSFLGALHVSFCSRKAGVQVFCDQYFAEVRAPFEETLHWREIALGLSLCLILHSSF